MEGKINKIALIAALDKERDLLAQALDASRQEDGCFISTYKGLEIIIARSGIAKVNAAVCTTEIIDRFHPDVIVNSGVAGGCLPGLKPLDVVAGAACVVS